MSKKDKLIRRFKSQPKDFTWHELETLLASLGYVENKTGKTGGSRRRFIHEEAPAIFLHKPHPSPILKSYAVRQILDILMKEKML